MKLKSKLGKSKLGFSLVELSVSILIVAILMFLVIQGGDLISQGKLNLARQKTANSPVAKMKGLILWLETTMPDSFLTSEVTDGGTLTAWNDISGSNPNSSIVFTPVNALNPPIYRSGEINGIPAVSFNSQFSYLNSNLRNVGTGGFAVFSVVLHKDSSTASIFSITDASSSFSAYISSGTYYCFFFNLGPTSSPMGAGSSLNGSPVILLSSRDNSANYISRINGALYAPVSGVTDDVSGIDAVNEMRIGSNNSQLHISEIIIFDRALSDQEIEEVERYLSDKYNITISS